MTPDQSPTPEPESPVATGLAYLHPDGVSAQHKLEGSDWFAVFNPKIPRALNVNLVNTLAITVFCVRFSSDGKYLATGCNHTAQIYDAATSQQICVLFDDSNKNHDMYIRSACFSPDGKYLATGGEDKLISIWDIKTRSIFHLFQGHKQDVYSLDFSRDGRLIASGSSDHTVRRWDMETRKCLFTLVIDDVSVKDTGVTSVVLSPEGRYVAAGSLDNFVRVWDTNTGQLLDKLEGHQDSVYSVAFSPDGKSLFSESLGTTIKFWDLSSLNRGATPGKKGGSTCLNTFLGHKLGSFRVQGQGVQFWDPHAAQLQFMLQGSKDSALSPTEKLFATGSGDCHACLWSYENITPLDK